MLLQENCFHLQEDSTKKIIHSFISLKELTNIENDCPNFKTTCQGDSKRSKSKLETHLEAQLPSLTVQYFSYLLPSVYSIIYSVGKVCDKFLILSRFDPISFQEESELLPYCSRMQVVFYHS